MERFDKVKSDKIAQDLLEMSFEVGGRGPEKIDCYGVLVHYYEQFGLKMPDYSSEENWENRGEVYLREYATMARKLDPDEKPEVGDFILFKEVEGEPNHAGVYLGDSRFVHSYQKIGVKIDSLVQFWGKKVYGYFRMK